MKDEQLDQLLRDEARAAREGRRKPRRSDYVRHQREKCVCAGYHFPHRLGGGACIHSERSDYYHALRQGVPQADAMLLLTAGQLEAMFPLGDTLAE